jgi:hypothetical protein
MRLLEKKSTEQTYFDGAQWNNYNTKSDNGRVFGCELIATSDKILISAGLLVVRGYRVSFDNEQLINFNAFPTTNDLMNLVLRINVSANDSEAIITTEPASNYDAIEKGIGIYDYILATFVLTLEGIIDLTPLVRNINQDSNIDIVRIQEANLSESALLSLISTLSDDIYIINSANYGDEFLFIQKNRTIVTRYTCVGDALILDQGQWISSFENSNAGTRWFNGTLVTGTSSNIWINNADLANQCRPGDIYRNNSTQNTYSCLAKDTGKSQWKYESNIRGIESGILTNDNKATISNMIDEKVCETALTISHPINTVGRIVRLDSAHNYVDTVEYHMPCTQKFDADGVPVSMQVVKDIGIKVTGSNLFDINSHTGKHSGFTISGSQITMITSGNSALPSLKIVGLSGDALADEFYLYLINGTTDETIYTGYKTFTFLCTNPGVSAFNFGLGGKVQDCTAQYINELFLPDTTYTISFNLVTYEANKIVIKDLMVSLGSEAEPYEAYKEKRIEQPLVTESGETIIGCGINLQNCDRLIKETNEIELNCWYVSNPSAYSWSTYAWGSYYQNETTSYFYLSYSAFGANGSYSLPPICNKLQNKNVTSTATSTVEGIRCHSVSFPVGIRLLNTRLNITSADTTTSKVTKLKNWLTANNVQIVFRRNTPGARVKLASPAVDIPGISEGFNTIICYNINKDAENVPALMDITELQAGEAGRYCVLKNNEDISLYPMTYADTVLMADGSTVEDEINSLKAKLNALIGNTGNAGDTNE